MAWAPQPNREQIYPRVRLTRANRSSDACAVIVHMPLPGIGPPIVDERGVETVRRVVAEEKRDRIARHPPTTNARRIEGRGAARIFMAVLRAGLGPSRRSRSPRSPAPGS